MKKFIFSLVMALMAIVSVNAQIATENSNALDNIAAGVTVGASTPLDFNSVFPLNTNVGVKVQKDFTPVFGAQIEALAFLNDNHFADIKTLVKTTNLGFNGVINLSNAFCGYNGTPRTFEVSAVAGLGWLRAWDIKDNSLSAKTGVDLTLNLGKNKAHSFVLTPAVYWNLHKIDAIQFTKHGAQLALNLTYMYHFKTSNGTHHFKTYDVGAMISEIDRLNGALAECESREPKVVEKIVVKEVPVTVDGQKVVVDENGTPVTNGTDRDAWIVPFNNNSAYLNVEAHFILNQIGRNSVVDIVATASTTGTDEYNQKLSEWRAKSVATYLKGRGVKVNSAVGKGKNPESGRVAIVTLTK